MTRYSLSVALVASILIVAFRPACAGQELGKVARHGLVGKAGPVALLEFEKDQAICDARIVKVPSGATSVAASTYFAGDYGKTIKLGIVKLRDTTNTGRFFITVEVSNESSQLSTEYNFSTDARNSPKEYFAPRTKVFSDSQWTWVYSYTESFPKTELRVELRACKGGKPVK